ncbi:hypothetical protein NPIL_144031 [Nephila pilipes]|uniref:Uncharacterized protein n=1 Tax=Nephila pilipes TaxID=299642 RepID=A0A8X6MPL7_NEPPI|nr:hypothetical protein NPIL_144031 [Nephila pilipes]
MLPCTSRSLRLIFVLLGLEGTVFITSQLNIIIHYSDQFLPRATLGRFAFSDWYLYLEEYRPTFIMKIISFTSICVCIFIFLPYQIQGFACKTDICNVLPALGPFCCIFMQTCCDIAVQRLQGSFIKPLSECKTSAAVAAAASPR